MSAIFEAALWQGVPTGLQYGSQSGARVKRVNMISVRLLLLFLSLPTAPAPIVKCGDPGTCPAGKCC